MPHPILGDPDSVGLFELSVAILLDPRVGFSYLQAIEVVGRRGATKVFNPSFLRAFSPDLPYDRPDSLDVVGAIKAIGKIRKIIWKLVYKYFYSANCHQPNFLDIACKLVPRLSLLPSSWGDFVGR